MHYHWWKSSGAYYSEDEDEDALLISSHNRQMKADETETFELALPKRDSFMTSWGPVGFKKKLHPLSIMVTK